MIIIKINEINETNETTKTKKNVNSKIRILIIIFTMRKFLAERASIQKRRFEIIKNFVNMLFIKRLYDIYAYKKNVF